MSSDHAARPHPPSSQRSAQARAHGHLPRAPLAGPVFVLLSLGVSAWALAPRVRTLCMAVAREPLELAARGDGTRARERAFQLLGELSVVCTTGLLVVLLSLVLGLIVVQGPAFARSSRWHRVSFPALSVSRTASALWCVGVAFIVLLALRQWADLELDTLGASVRTWASQLAVLSVAALLVDVAFARARFHASLWLTRREYQDEQRAALGPPQARHARQRARRAMFNVRDQSASPQADT